MSDTQKTIKMLSELPTNISSTLSMRELFEVLIIMLNINEQDDFEPTTEDFLNALSIRISIQKGLDDIEIYINKDLYDFYGSNYETIINLNTKIANIKETYGYIFSVKFLLNSNITSEFDSTNNKIEVYNQFGNLTRWEDVLDKYLQ